MFRRRQSPDGGHDIETANSVGRDAYCAQSDDHAQTISHNGATGFKVGEHGEAFRRTAPARLEDAVNHEYDDCAGAQPKGYTNGARYQ